MAYSVLLRPAAVRDLKALPTDMRRRVEATIDRLKDEPRPSGVKKLVGFDNEWRLRVGDYRVLYIIDDPHKHVLVARCRPSAERCIDEKVGTDLPKRESLVMQGVKIGTNSREFRRILECCAGAYRYARTCLCTRQP
jgi:mRNA interferase RelE/StbE